MHGIEFHPSIENDLLLAARCNEDKSGGLGLRFLEDYDRTIKEILNCPEAWPILEKDVRLHQFEHFPYGVIYRLFPSTIRILIIMHLHQTPKPWENRI